MLLRFGLDEGAERLGAAPSSRGRVGGHFGRAGTFCGQPGFVPYAPDGRPMVAALASDAPFAPAQAQQAQDRFPFGHAQLVHGVAYATSPWHARAGSVAVVHFQLPTDPWYHFNCPRVVHFACPPRDHKPAVRTLDRNLSRRHGGDSRHRSTRPSRFRVRLCRRELPAQNQGPGEAVAGRQRPQGFNFKIPLRVQIERPVTKSAYDPQDRGNDESARSALPLLSFLTGVDSAATCRLAWMVRDPTHCA